MIAVAGGTGSVVAHVMRRLASQGEPVRHVVLPASAGPSRGPGRPRWEDVEAVLHVGAWPPHHAWDEPGGTLAALEGARAVAARRFIHVSALGARPEHHSRIVSALWVAEEAVRQSGLPFVILRTGLLFGGDEGLISCLLQTVLQSPFVLMPTPGRSRQQPVWVGDVASCIVRTLQAQWSPGQTLDLAGPEQLSVGELVALLVRAVGGGRIRLRLPHRSMRALFGLMGVGSRSALAAARELEVAQVEAIAAPQAIRETFGFHPMPLGEGLTYMIKERRGKKRPPGA